MSRDNIKNRSMSMSISFRPTAVLIEEHMKRSWAALLCEVEVAKRRGGRQSSAVIFKLLDTLLGLKVTDIDAIPDEYLFALQVVQTDCLDTLQPVLHQNETILHFLRLYYKDRFKSLEIGENVSFSHVQPLEEYQPTAKPKASRLEHATTDLRWNISLEALWAQEKMVDRHKLRTLLDAGLSAEQKQNYIDMHHSYTLAQRMVSTPALIKQLHFRLAKALTLDLHDKFCQKKAMGWALAQSVIQMAEQRHLKNITTEEMGKEVSRKLRRIRRRITRLQRLEEPANYGRCNESDTCPARIRSPSVSDTRESVRDLVPHAATLTTTST